MTARDLWSAMRRAAWLAGSFPSRPGERAAWKAGRAAATPVRFPRGSGHLRPLMDRAVRARGPAASTPLDRRLQAHLAGVYTDEIAARGGEVAIGQKSGQVGLSVVDRQGGYTLLGASAWRYYSSREGSHRATLTYLCGRDDAGRWAVRVPGTLNSVQAALAWLEPREVKAARRRGRQVLRQGDVYLVEARADDFAALGGTRHRWDNNARLVVHEGGHQQIAVPFRAKAVIQSVLRMGRQGQFRRHGD